MLTTTAATTTSTETILAQFPLSCTVENFAYFAYSTWVRANIRFTKKISLKLLPRLDRLASACLGQYCVSLLPFNLQSWKKKKIAWNWDNHVLFSARKPTPGIWSVESHIIFTISFLFQKVLPTDPDRAWGMPHKPELAQVTSTGLDAKLSNVGIVLKAKSRD